MDCVVYIPKKYTSKNVPCQKIEEMRMKKQNKLVILTPGIGKLSIWFQELCKGQIKTCLSFQFHCLGNPAFAPQNQDHPLGEARHWHWAMGNENFSPVAGRTQEHMQPVTKVPLRQSVRTEGLPVFVNALFSTSDLLIWSVYTQRIQKIQKECVDI